MLDDGDAAGEPGRDFAAQHLGAGPHVSSLAKSMPSAKHSNAANARCRMSRERARNVSAATAVTDAATVSEIGLAADGEIAERTGCQQHRREQEGGAALPFGGERQAKRCRPPIGRPGGSAGKANGRGEQRRLRPCDPSPGADPAAAQARPASDPRGRAQTGRARRAASQAEFWAEPCRAGPPFPTPRGTGRLCYISASEMPCAGEKTLSTGSASSLSSRRRHLTVENKWLRIVPQPTPPLKRIHGVGRSVDFAVGLAAVALHHIDPLVEQPGDVVPQSQKIIRTQMGLGIEVDDDADVAGNAACSTPCRCNSASCSRRMAMTLWRSIP